MHTIVRPDPISSEAVPKILDSAKRYLLAAALCVPGAMVSLPPASAQGAVDDTEVTSPPVAGYRIVSVYPHDRRAFTQGLVFVDGYLLEGTGLRGHSSLRKVNLASGRILKYRRVPPAYFGEGITVFKDTILQLTWRSRTGFAYRLDTFEPIHQFHYAGEGWGLTHDGCRLIMSDGTARLRFLDPVTYRELAHVDVHDARGSVTRLNELEYVEGEIYANVWHTDRIARISPDTGAVVGWIKLTGLLGGDRKGAGVLNGIAYDGASKRLFVTGKNWPKLFEIEVVGNAARPMNTGRSRKNCKNSDDDE